jgi:RNA polymerase sigma-70 factor (ECF subfamily)
MSGDAATALSDEQLISRLAAGEVALLGELYLRHDAMVKAALGRFASDISFEEREDLAQEVFIAVNESASRFPPGVEFRAWLYGVAVKKARAWRRNNWLRRKLLRKKRGTPVGMALSVDASPARRSELRQLIVKALSSLSDAEREVIMLRAIEGFSGDEIAMILGISHGSVRVRLHRARARIEEHLSAELVAEALRGDNP